MGSEEVLGIRAKKILDFHFRLSLELRISFARYKRTIKVPMLEFEIQKSRPSKHRKSKITSSPNLLVLLVDNEQRLSKSGEIPNDSIK